MKEKLKIKAVIQCRVLELLHYTFKALEIIVFPFYMILLMWKVVGSEVSESCLRKIVDISTNKQNLK